MKTSSTPTTLRSIGLPLLGWFTLLFLAYGKLILHPDLHLACPENDTWNFPIRFSVLNSYRMGRIPLWNPLSAFGIPWLATWQTESFYPGTFFFTRWGLGFWNASGLLHLLILSSGTFLFLRSLGVNPFWAFFSSGISLLNGCAVNHLGSNSSMDTMAWIPWMFLAARQTFERKPWGRIGLAAAFTLQIFAGYPQIVLYTLVGCSLYATICHGWRSLFRLMAPLSAGLLASSAQWLPSVEYFLIDSVRLPAVHDNPHFFLPLKNIRTFFDFNALDKNVVPDYVADPTFFYFNFYSGLVPLAFLLWGLIRFNRLKGITRFFLIGFFFCTLWTLGYLLIGLDMLHIPFPAFLEPAKSWVVLVFFELTAFGLIAEDLFPKAGNWKWILGAVALFQLLLPIWSHPLERNLTPPNDSLSLEAQKIKAQMGSGRVLVLTDPGERQALYTPEPDPSLKPLFKHFIPNSNYFAGLASPVFYGSTQPSWGALDAGLYFQYGFPYDKGTLLDLLGIDILILPQARMPSRFEKLMFEEDWSFWKNPSSLGSHFIFTGTPQNADRKTVFTAFANGQTQPLRDLFLDPQPISQASLCEKAPIGAQEIPIPPGGPDRYLVITQNAIPGWRAWVDGRPVKIFLGDGLFQCFPLKVDAQRVELSYEPASFRFGLFLSFWSFALMGAWKMIRMKRGPKSPAFRRKR